MPPEPAVTVFGPAAVNTVAAAAPPTKSSPPLPPNASKPVLPVPAVTVVALVRPLIVSPVPMSSTFN